MTWIVAFAITQCVEVPIYGWWLRDVPWPRRFALAFTTSALTHPWLWFVLPEWLRQPLGYVGYVAVGETLVWLAEAGLLVLANVAPRRALLAALCANVASLSVGFLWSALT